MKEKENGSALSHPEQFTEACVWPPIKACGGLMGVQMKADCVSDERNDDFIITCFNAKNGVSLKY